ncbi:hypothetical protein MKEN_00265500 [Mycena kentingensis (nom. inval.)]|nr:hypothetical protein MKEN_00265500 [Mycena kentingensis (nom. inval.)]
MAYALLALLSLVILALLVLSLSHSRSHSSKKDASGRHFTIPILSPFTSVIEHETSVIGGTALAVFGLAAAALGYAMFRHWVGRAR